MFGFGDRAKRTFSKGSDWASRKMLSRSNYGAVRADERARLKEKRLHEVNERKGKEKAERSFERSKVRAEPNTIFEQHSYKSGRGGWL